MSVIHHASKIKITRELNTKKISDLFIEIFGGGIIFGLNCARVAAEVVSESLNKKDFSAQFLEQYQKKCEKMFGFDVKVMLKMKKILNLE